MDEQNFVSLRIDIYPVKMKEHFENLHYMQL